MVLALAVTLSACGGDDDGSDDCTWPDPEALCPEAFAFEAFLSDLETGDAAFDVAVSQRGQAGVTTTSAPNGRATLCLTGGDVEIQAVQAEYLTRRDTLDACAVARAASASQPYPIAMISAEDVDARLTAAGLERDETASQVLVTVVTFTDAGPMVAPGSAIDLEPAGDGFAPGGDDVALFANVPGDEVALNIGADGLDCVGPAVAALEPGGVTGVLFACE
jgi:hypothetical protein